MVVNQVIIPEGLKGTLKANLGIAPGDLENALKRALDAGAKLLAPIETMTVDEGRRCRIADPSGYLWTLAGP